MMERATKNIEQKLILIARIQNSLKKKKVEQVQLLNQAHMQLPAINSYTESYPFQRRQPYIKQFKQISTMGIHAQKSGRQESIAINYSCRRRDQQMLNKIIFTSPLSNRTRLNQTGFRTSYYGKSNDKVPCNYRSVANDRRYIRQINQDTLDLAFFPVRINLQRDSQLENISAMFERVRNQRTVQIYQNYSNMLRLSQDKLIEGRRKRQSQRGIGKQIKSSLDRYSPWANENEEQFYLIK